jgi:hypothetical protein
MKRIFPFSNPFIKGASKLGVYFCILTINSNLLWAGGYSLLDSVQCQNAKIIEISKTATELERWELIKSRLFCGSEPENLAVVNALLARGIKLDRTDQNGQDLLHLAVYAITSGHKFEIVKTLIANGADIDSIDRNGVTPLGLVADSDQEHGELIKFLIEKGANPDHIEASGHTALNRTVYNGKYENAKALLENGARPDLRFLPAQNSYRFSELIKKFARERSEQPKDRGIDPRIEQERKKAEEQRAKNVDYQEKKLTIPLQTQPKEETLPTYADANPLEAFKNGFSETNQAKRRAAIAAFEKYKGPHRKALFELAIKSGYPNVIQKAEELISTLPEKDEFTALWMHSDDAHIRQFGMENQKRRGSVESLSEQGSKTEPVLAANLKSEKSQVNFKADACRPAVNPQGDFSAIEKSAEVIAAVIPKQKIKEIVKSSGGPGQGPILSVNADDPRVSPKFAALGKMHQVGNVVWSGIFTRPKTLFKSGGVKDQLEAARFCDGLGGGARLPTLSEFEALGNAMGIGRPEGYSNKMFPDMYHASHFWPSDSKTGFFTYFYPSRGELTNNFKNKSGASVMCVVSP